MRKRSKLEQETIILFNEAEKTAEVYTFNARLQRKLTDMAREYPEIRLIKANPPGAVAYQLPKNLIAIRKPTSEATRQAMRERMQTSNPFAKSPKN